MRFSKPVLVSLLWVLSAKFLFAIPSWESLGGSFQGRPVVVLGSDLRLEAFIRGTDNALWFAAQATAGGSWTPFMSLGGVIISNPSAVKDTTGRIAVFALGTDNAVWTRSQITAGVDNYSDWTSIGGNGTTDLAVLQTYPQQHFPSSVAYLFMRGADNALWYNSTSDASAPWGQWRSLGGVLTSAPGAGVNTNNQATVFARGGDNALWYRQIVYPGGSFKDWVSLGGAMNGPPCDSEVNGYVMYQGIDNAAWFILDTTPAVGGGNVVPATWSDHVSLGGYIISNPTTPKHLNTNDLEVFGVGIDNALWVTISNGSTFGPWQSLGGNVGGDPVAARNWNDGTIEVFAIGSGGTLSHIRQSAAASWE
jgi:hypothetical protein